MKFPTDLLEKQNPTRNDYLLLGDSEDEGTAKKVQAGEFATSDELAAHIINKENPHGVTAAQIGAATNDALALHLGDKGDPHQTLPEGGQPGQVLLVQPNNLAGWSNKLTTLEQQVSEINGSKVDRAEWKELVPGHAYQRPDGIIEQWVVSAQVTAGWSGNVLWPIPFPNAVINAIAAPIGVNSDNNAGNVVRGALTTIGANLYNWGTISATAIVYAWGR